MKRMLRIFLTLMLILVVILGIAAYFQVYVIRDGAAATLFGRGDEAYLFLGTSHTGYRFSYLNYILEGIKEYFHVISEPTDESTSGTVLHVTPSGVEQDVMKFGDNSLSVTAFLTPFDDGIYAMCSGAVFCKWNGDGFRPATEDEERNHGGIARLFRGSVNNQIINGWSAREVLPGDHFDVNVGNKFIISANNHNIGLGLHNEITVDLVRPNHAPQRLYHANGSPRRVSKVEYDGYFGKR